VLHWLFSYGVCSKFAQFASQWEVRADTSEEMSQTLVTKKKQGNLDQVHATTTLLSQRKIALTPRNTLFAL
jgi:hypothetical protein